VGVGLEAAVTDHDPVLIRDVRRHPGDGLQIVHPLRLLLGVVAVADPY